jgi:hypothetical protein
VTRKEPTVPKDVDLTAPAKTREELLRRATGQTAPGGKLPPVPPPAKPLPAGVRGTPPLPIGKVVGARSPSSLTPAERQFMENMGWDETVPIPQNLRAVVEQSQAEQLARSSEAELPLPIDPRTPPLHVQTHDIGQLDPAAQERFRNLLRSQYGKEQEALEQATSLKQAGLRESQVPGIGQALRAADAEVLNDLDAAGLQAVAVAPPATQAVAREVARQRQAGIDPTGQAPPAAPPPEPAPPPAAPAASETGANAGPAYCPHCNWDLSQPDGTEPSDADKNAFIQAVLGQKCFTKSYDLLGGTVTLTLRTLTAPEVDEIYKQAYRERELGRAPTELDFWERINRYRLFLQVQVVRAAGDKGFLHDLPDGLSRRTNPDGTGFWWKEENDSLLESGETALPRVEEHMTGRVLKTEAMYRIVHNTCNQFNRLVAKMEALVDNSDFWKPTGTPS